MDSAGLVKSAIGGVLARDLDALRREVEAYLDERQLWRTVPGLPNTAGTLVLHLAGNLQHFFGARLGGSAYVRDRPAEFARRDVSRAELLREIAAAREAVKAGLQRLSAAQLGDDFPEIVAGTRLNTAEYLVHLTGHFTYHLGQIDAHRRMVTGDSSSVGAVRPSDLSSARPVEVKA